MRISEWIVIRPAREIAVSWPDLCIGDASGGAKQERKRETAYASARARRRDA
ncbi:MAG TPA: hypothetical protein VLN49_23275 [Gemmatimonadaceae bacterium]|nr:hypothetical protein [Gemmatimonadaceae bacterium]